MRKRTRQPGWSIGQRTHSTPQAAQNQPSFRVPLHSRANPIIQGCVGVLVRGSETCVGLLRSACPGMLKLLTMLLLRETTRVLPFYRPVPLTNLPLLYHREHLFPYTSYGETESSPVPRAFRMVILENDFLRIEVAPELGGRVYSLFDKRIGQELLFSNPVVKPARILPIWGFISGGMEFNFPIAHSPTSLAEVGFSAGSTGGYGYVRAGEREARTGMEWVVEMGLAESCPALIQRTMFRNATGADHPWMSWTITAVRSTPETEFVHPPHRVLVHDDRVRECAWPGDGLNWDRNARQMTALFWKPGSAPCFGAFHHDLGFGLMHVADPTVLPGKKVWTYGHGRHRSWGQATTEGGLSYAEIESGPLLDQSEKPRFPRGTERRFEEFWIPVYTRSACEQVTLPTLELPPMEDPWLGWKHSVWQTDWEQFSAGEGPLPRSTVATGIELEKALRREKESGNERATEPLALWLAFRGRPEDALECLHRIPALSPSTTDSAPDRASLRRTEGLILWKALHQAEAAVPHLEAGPLHDPVAVTELDELYAELGLNTQRAALLAQAPPHRRVIERRAAWALAQGQPAETLRLLSETSWPREHQRYVRTDLFQRAKAVLGEPEAAVPDFLNEDNLARFGAYWSDA